MFRQYFDSNAPATFKIWDKYLTGCPTRKEIAVDICTYTDICYPKQILEMLAFLRNTIKIFFKRIILVLYK